MSNNLTKLIQKVIHESVCYSLVPVEILACDDQFQVEFQTIYMGCVTPDGSMCVVTYTIHQKSVTSKVIVEFMEINGQVIVAEKGTSKKTGGIMYEQTLCISSTNIFPEPFSLKVCISAVIQNHSFRQTFFLTINNANSTNQLFYNVTQLE